MDQILYEEYMHWCEKQDGFKGWPTLLAVHGIAGILEDYELWLEREKKKRLYD